MAERKRKYICGCGADFSTSQGLNAHLKVAGCPREQVRVVDTKSGESRPLTMGRPAKNPQGTPQRQQPRAQGAVEVVVEGNPEPEVEELPADSGKTRETKKPVVSPFAVSLYRMVPMTATIYNTPPLWTSFAVAKLRGFKGDLNEFIAMTAIQFWLDREINPFEELTVLFQEVPSSLQEKIALAMGGSDEPGHIGVAQQTAEGEKGD